MKIVFEEDKFEELFLTAKSEAQKYFGNDEVYIEKFSGSRHIEKFEFYLGKIGLYIFMKEIVQYKEDIKN